MTTNERISARVISLIGRIYTICEEGKMPHPTRVTQVGPGIVSLLWSSREREVTVTPVDTGAMMFSQVMYEFDRDGQLDKTHTVGGHFFKIEAFERLLAWFLETKAANA